jgi:hypothetical protein
MLKNVPNIGRFSDLAANTPALRGKDQMPFRDLSQFVQSYGSNVRMTSFDMQFSASAPSRLPESPRRDTSPCRIQLWQFG